tara:strand:- start:805 stop:2139 length:1335 start_codon:yes stop_codon:yes gene_type:complete
MNLKQMREDIFAKMNYRPNATNYIEMIRISLNEQYSELCSMRNWLFLERRTNLQIKKKIEGIAGGTEFISVGAANLRLITCTGFVPNVEMEGQLFTNTDTGVEYTIVRVLGQDIFISDNWDGLTATSIYTFSISFQRVALPVDCLEPESFTSASDDWGPISFISQATEDHYYLDKESTGQPLVAIDDEWLIQTPPIKTLRVAFGLAGGDFDTSQTFEYCYTIYRNGSESPPSVAVQYTTPPVVSFKISLTNLDDTGYFETAAAGTTLDSGMQKIIYRRDITNNGRWRLIGTVDSTITSFTDEFQNPKAIFTLKNNSAFRFSNTSEHIQFDEATPRQHVRFWWTPDTDKPINMRYTASPKELVADTDVPIFGKQYHKILVYLTLQDLFLKTQNTEMFRYYEIRSKKVLTAMTNKYIKRDGQDIVFGSWSGNSRGYNRNYGTPSIS